MVLLHTPPGELGSGAADFSLPGVDDQTHTLADYSDGKALVVMFICNHCPYVLAVETRLIQLCRDLMPKGAQFVAISSNDPTNYPDDSFESMQKRSKEQGYPFDYLFDESQSVAKAYGAVCTPDFFVFDKDQKLKYRGRLDDSPRNPTAVKNEEMRAAIEAVIEGNPVAEEQNAAMGCSIKWRD